MDMKIAARMIAVFTIGAGLSAAIAILHDEKDRPDADASRIERPGGEPFSLSAKKSELVRCRDLGTAALEDNACRSAWEENRRRFFGMETPERPVMPVSQRWGPAPPDQGNPPDSPLATDEGQSPAKNTGEVTKAIRGVDGNTGSFSSATPAAAQPFWMMPQGTPETDENKAGE